MALEQDTLVAGKYRTERVLGEGGMGRVVAAMHEQLGQRVAIKFLLPHALNSPNAVKRFLREARAAVRLKSEHVGRVIDVGTLDTGSPYIVMEYLEGNDLSAEISRNGRLEQKVAIDYVLQACEAIAEAHAHGIVHRDIKPANLFLTQRPDGSALIKVLDFGIAKAAPGDPSFNMTGTQAVIGSPGYMSPEQLRCTRDTDARSDIWGLGIVLYQLISGRKPFRGASYSDLCIRIATDPTPPLGVSGVDPTLECILERCLAKEPIDRFQDVAALAAALEPLAPPHHSDVSARIARVLRSPSSASATQPSARAVDAARAAGHASDQPDGDIAHSGFSLSAVSLSGFSFSDSDAGSQPLSRASTRILPLDGDSPTTLSAAAGETASGPKSRSRATWIAAAILVLLAGVTGALLALQDTSARGATEAPVAIPAAKPEPARARSAAKPPTVSETPASPQPAETLSSPAPTSKAASVEPKVVRRAAHKRGKRSKASRRKPAARPAKRAAADSRSNNDDELDLDVRK